MSDLTFAIHNCILAYNANAECVFSLVIFQLTKEQRKLDVTIVEAMLQCKWNRDSKEFINKFCKIRNCQKSRIIRENTFFKTKVYFYKQRIILSETMPSAIFYLKVHMYST